MVLETVVDVGDRQVLGNGQYGGLNVGGVIIFPNLGDRASGFRIASESVDNTRLQSFGSGYAAGPLGADGYTSLDFEIVAPAEPKSMTYPIVVGVNRGRGQLYPDGSMSNNNLVRAAGDGVATRVTKGKKATGQTLVTRG